MQQQGRLAHPTRLQFAYAVTQGFTWTTRLALQTHAPAPMELQQQEGSAQKTMLSIAPAALQAILSLTKVALQTHAPAATELQQPVVEELAEEEE